MDTESISAVRGMFNLISWDDENKLEAVVNSLEKLGEQHPEALQRFLEIFLTEQGVNGVVNVGTCNNCSDDVGYQLANNKLIYSCSNKRCENSCE